MKRLFLVTALSVALPAMAQNVASVNGKNITKSEVDAFAKVLRIEKPTADQQRAIVNELVNRSVLLQEASKQGIDKKADVKSAIEDARKTILINSLLQDWADKNKVPDSDLKKAYDDIVKNLADKREYKVRHILVKDESKAKEILADLKAKKVSFADAAKQNSIDSGAATNGGELNWHNPEDFIPEFANAVKTAKKGEVTDPVKTQFGYHLIEVEDERPVTPPTFEQVKGAIARELTQQKMAQYVESLRKKAKVQISDK
ncbi:peptidylprolyl isomerase [Pelistega europaea]|uniref:peptidylprolyl isomerase n=1 Tax=Pelistega europaea TaxID=106147 RepID=A0A7Y4L923_9BURK|nr:peptidylprolyl isomerase [Pelistega europaea]NOL49220.1 peptidylprolyl isomerase [Pelistega europaea]